jgi:crotonobetainyl-CoA:carnitine CoA-transferase CaiB-like acyl-CoA transferase
VTFRFVWGGWLYVLTALLHMNRADVVKIEPPRIGDPVRESGHVSTMPDARLYYHDAGQWGPFVTARSTTTGQDAVQNDESTIFLAMNRNKRSVTVDLTTSKGIELARKLVDRADVVVSSVSLPDGHAYCFQLVSLNWLLQFTPGVANQLGLTYTALKRTNLGLIYLAVTG